MNECKRCDGNSWILIKRKACFVAPKLYAGKDYLIDFAIPCPECNKGDEDDTWGNE